MICKDFITYYFFRRYKYYWVLFFSFFKSFIIWNLGFFLIFFSLQYIDIANGIAFKLKVFSCFVNSFEIFLDTINIVTLLCCIYFFLRTRNNFNFYVLESFGITSFNILKPIVVFLLLIGLTKIFLLRPLLVKMENTKKTIVNHFDVSEIRLKSGTKFTLIKEQDKKNYKIITGTYDYHTADKMEAKDVSILVYSNKNLSEIFSAKTAILKKDGIKIFGVNHLIKKNNDFDNIYDIKQLAIPVEINIKNAIQNIKNTQKLNKFLFLGLYEFAKVKKDSYKASKVNTDLIMQARLYFSNEIGSIFLLFLCAFMSFFFCVTSSRGVNILKTSIKCFLIYFLLTRILHQLSQIAQYSDISAICFVIIHIILCIVILLIILNKDWCGNIFRKIKKT